MHPNESELPYSFNTLVTECTIGKTHFRLLKGDLLASSCQVIVNPANAFLKPGGGICGAIYHAAGAEPFQECANLLHAFNHSQFEVGECVLTGKGHLPNPNIQAIAHTVGPIGEHPERQTKLRMAYQNALNIISNPAMEDYKADSVKGTCFSSIAFPSISTGIFHYPLHEASVVAIQAIKDFLHSSEHSIHSVELIVLENDQETLNTYLKAIEQA